MKVSVLFFAVVRERLRCDGETLDLDKGATLAQALADLTALHPGLAALLPRLRLAVNQTFVAPTHVLADGDEVALIPPVAGGSDPRRFAVRDDGLSLDEVVRAVTGPSQGGLVTFTGMVRRQGQQPNVARLEYEAYVPMAVDVLATIGAEIEREWPGTLVAIHHRIGTLMVGEIAVVIAVSAPHRAEAFAGCRAAIERLKERAPIWKKEIGDDGAEWIGSGP